MKRKLLAAIVAAAVIVSIIAVIIHFPSKHSENRSVINESSIESSVTDNSIFNDDKEKSISSEQLLSSLSTESEGEKLDIASVKWVQTDRIDESEMWYYSADTGHVFVILFIELENNTTEVQKISIIDFEIYVDDFKEKFITFSQNLEIAGYYPLLYYNFDEIEIKPNRKQSGYLAIDIENNWKEIEFIYNEDNDNTFVIKNN